MIEMSERMVLVLLFAGICMVAVGAVAAILLVSGYAGGCP